MTTKGRKKAKKGRNLTSRDTGKKLKLLLRYYLGALRRRASAAWPITLFVISVILFLSVLVPNALLHRLPIVGEWPRVLVLNGNVYFEENETRPGELIAVPGATVEIGGYRTVTNSEGEFRLKFVSDTSGDIPVLIEWFNITEIKRVTFDVGQYEKTEVFVLNDG